MSFPSISIIFIFGMLFWVLTGSPEEKAKRFCDPLELLGEITVAGAALISEPTKAKTEEFKISTVYSCQYMFWKVVYEEKYLKEIEELRRQFNIDDTGEGEDK